MHSIAFALALIAGCAGDTPQTPEPEEVVKEEPDGPPEGFVCPAGAVPTTGDAAAAHWFAPTLPQLSGDGPWNPPDEELEAKSIVPDKTDGDQVWVCLREDGTPHGAYAAMIADGEGKIEGSFVEGKASGPWLGLWIIDEPAEEPAAEEPAAEEPPAEEPPAEEAPAEGAPGDGEAPAEGDAPAEEEPEDAAPATPEGTRLMFRGSYTAGAQTGNWTWGCDPGCFLDARAQGRFNEQGLPHGQWTWSGDQESVTAFFLQGDLNGRYAHTYMEQTTTGHYNLGKKKGKWVTKKGDEVIETVDHGGTVRRSRGGRRGGGGRR